MKFNLNSYQLIKPNIIFINNIKGYNLNRNKFSGLIFSGLINIYWQKISHLLFKKYTYIKIEKYYIYNIYNNTYYI